MKKFADMHCDTIHRIYNERKAGHEWNLRENKGHIDLLRMKEAGYSMQTFAMYVNLERSDDAMQECLDLIDIFYNEMDNNADLIRPVTSVSQILENEKKGLMSALLSIEEGGVCRGDLGVLRDFYRLGARMMTLTWNFENELAFPNKMKGGLKERGIEFVQEMEKLGILIDVSHLSDDGFEDVYRYTEKPFIASHSNARSQCAHARNLTDEFLRKLGERGGVAGLNFAAGFVNEPKDGEEAFGDIAGLVRHARYMANIGGIGCVALGTDYDGIGDSIELKNCSYMPKLADALLKSGFHESEVDAILHDNVLRVMGEVLK